jgi:hypothetical protein
MLFFTFLIFFELTIFLLTIKYKKNFKWIVTNEDEFPIKNQKKLNTFLSNNFSSKLGWDRKPNTSGEEYNGKKKTFFSINKQGYRSLQKKFRTTKVITFGDSYAFGKYVNNNETWQNYLSKEIRSNIENYGVANFGLDQAYLKYKSTKITNGVKYIIFGFVPETICRIHSYWKHYYEFGNVYGFKPIFFREKPNRKFKKVESFLNYYNEISKIKKNLYKIKKFDHFYKSKFKKRIIKFPYFFYFLKNFNINFIVYFLLFFTLISSKKKKKNYYKKALKIIIRQNIKEANNLYLDQQLSENLKDLIGMIDIDIKKKKIKTLFLVIPQKEDLKLDKEFRFYEQFYKKLSKTINVLDLTNDFLEYSKTDDLYEDDKYASHLSVKGNKLVSKTLKKYIQNDK